MYRRRNNVVCVQGLINFYFFSQDHNTYIVNIKDEEELCERENLQVTELSSSKTGLHKKIIFM